MISFPGADLGGFGEGGGGSVEAPKLKPMTFFTKRDINCLLQIARTIPVTSVVIPLKFCTFYYVISTVYKLRV